MPVTIRTLSLRSPWSVSHGTTTSREAVFVDLEPGLGEAPIVPYYPYTTSAVRDWIEHVEPLLEPDTDVPPESVLARLPEGPPPARSALDCALHDRWASNRGMPLAQALGIDVSTLPLSSISIGIPDDEDSFAQSLERVADWPIIKLKLGTGSIERDLSIVRTARRHSSARLFVDANGAWTQDEAPSIISALGGELGVEVVEEPLKSRLPEAWHALRSRLPDDVPLLIADESVQHDDDVRNLAGAADGINVKIAKAGGLYPARQLIALAREHGMRVLIGCMIETSLGVTAAANLAALADFADLDGHLQLDYDPFHGVKVERGRIILPQRPGLGVVPGSMGREAGGIAGGALAVKT